MKEQNLFKPTSEPDQKKVKGSQVAVIRTLIRRGLNTKQIRKETGFLLRHINKTVGNYPAWLVKQESKVKATRLTRLLTGEDVKLYGVVVMFLRYSKTHVYFVNTNGKIESIKKEDFIGEAFV